MPEILCFIPSRECFQSSAQVGRSSASCAVWEGVEASDGFLYRLTKKSSCFYYIPTFRSTWCSNFLGILRYSTISCYFSTFPAPVLGVSFLKSEKSVITCLTTFPFPKFCYFFPLFSPCPYEIQNKTKQNYYCFRWISRGS